MIQIGIGQFGPVQLVSAYDTGKAMMADLTSDELATAGLEQAVRSLRGNHPQNFTLWKPEALQRFKELFVGGKLSLDKFEGLRALLRTRLNWGIKIADYEEWPRYADPSDGPFAVLELTREDGSTGRIVLRPEGDVIRTVETIAAVA